MSNRSMPIVALCEMVPDQEADLFALMTAKEELTTKNGKPYFRVAFRDAQREVSFPIWDNSPWAADCRTSWTPGVFYKLRAVYRETNFGPQLDIRKIREVADGDAADGFDPAMCRCQSRFDPSAMLDELLALAAERIDNAPLAGLVASILTAHREQLLAAPAAQHNHHTYCGGLLEHTLSVTRCCVYLADKYAEYYTDLQPPLDKGLVVAGAILHDIGKLRIPKEILDSPIKLSPNNEAVFRTHPVKGVAMCASLPLSVDVINAILFHHERMDGSGYPSGIAGEAIPLPVRVLALADAYETLIAGRPQTKGLTPYQALRVLSEDRKGAFDPETVKRLVLVLSGADMME